MVERHRRARAAVTDEMVDAFMAVRPLPNIRDQITTKQPTASKLNHHSVIVPSTSTLHLSFVFLLHSYRQLILQPVMCHTQHFLLSVSQNVGDCKFAYASSSNLKSLRLSNVDKKMSNYLEFRYLNDMADVTFQEAIKKYDVKGTTMKAETKDSWTWFLQLLEIDIGSFMMKGITFISVNKSGLKVVKGLKKSRHLNET
ncbi:hypothetical protein Csa_018486 [Cucumis sativus]|nr:hypothetical protein Csa_018486 [Cucumis sativus]